MVFSALKRHSEALWADATGTLQGGAGFAKTKFNRMRLNFSGHKKGASQTREFPLIESVSDGLPKPGYRKSGTSSTEEPDDASDETNSVTTYWLLPRQGRVPI